jgi:hypothetical protein
VQRLPWSNLNRSLAHCPQLNDLLQAQPKPPSRETGMPPLIDAAFVQGIWLATVRAFLSVGFYTALAQKEIEVTQGYMERLMRSLDGEENPTETRELIPDWESLKADFVKKARVLVLGKDAAKNPSQRVYTKLGRQRGEGALTRDERIALVQNLVAVAHSTRSCEARTHLPLICY